MHQEGLTNALQLPVKADLADLHVSLKNLIDSPAQVGEGALFQDFFPDQQQVISALIGEFSDSERSTESYVDIESSEGRLASSFQHAFAFCSLFIWVVFHHSLDCNGPLCGLLR